MHGNDVELPRISSQNSNQNIKIIYFKILHIYLFLKAKDIPVVFSPNRSKYLIAEDAAK